MLNHKLHILALLGLNGIGKKTVADIIKNASFTPSNLQELWELFESTSKRKLSLTKNDLKVSWYLAEKLIEAHENYQIKIISIGDNEYPQKLLQISNPPLILYVKGDVNFLNYEKSIAVIGTRHPSEYGREKARKIGKFLAEKGLTVVSGLAIGCDTEGHQGCLDGKGTTIAVLAHGLDEVHPAANRNLAQNILDSGGCLVSEYKVSSRIFRRTFVERNRIMSGLSSAVIVIETGIKGGSLHTARFCLEQGKELACINHQMEEQTSTSEGNQKLLREEKATSLETLEDLSNLINRVFGSGLTQ